MAAPPAAVSHALVCCSAGDGAIVPVSDVVSDLRRTLDRISKKAAAERRENETIVRNLKSAAKQGSRDLYLNLSKMESNLLYQQREEKRLKSQYVYFRKKVGSLQTELTELKKKLHDARAEAVAAERRALEAEISARYKDGLLEKSADRRAAAERAYREQADSLRVAKQHVGQAQSDAAASQTRLMEAECALRRSVPRQKGRSCGTQTCAAWDDAEAPPGPSGEMVVAEAEDDLEAAEEELEPEMEERDALAMLTTELVDELYVARQMAYDLQHEVEKNSVPKFRDMNAVPSKRSQRRLSQTDVEWLESLFTQRPWRVADISRALERAELLEGVCNSRPVRRRL